MSEVTTKPTGAALTVFKTPADFQSALEAQRIQAITAYMGDESNARKFIMAVVSDVQRIPKLLECPPDNLITEYMKMAELGFMPSSVSGEAYVIPYAKKAQMQVGYKGIATLLFAAGNLKIDSAIIREHDTYSYDEGVITHKVDMSKSKEQRGKAIGAYTKVTLASGEISYYFMNEADIMAHAKNFSKSFSFSDSPWKEGKDPELWMWRKTVLIQHSKLLPRNEKLNKALEYDYEDSNVGNKKGGSIIDVTSYEEQELEDALTKMEGAKDRAELLEIWGKLPTAIKANPHVREKSKQVGASFDPK